MKAAKLISGQFLSADDLVMSLDYLQAHGSCQPSDGYIWGFSAPILLLFCIFTFLFATILTALHIESFRSSRTGRSKYEVNLYRDAIDLVYELQDKFFGEFLRDMSAQDLKEELGCSRKGISIEASELPLSRKEERRQRRLTEEKGPTGRRFTAMWRVKYEALLCVEFLKTVFLRNKVGR